MSDVALFNVLAGVCELVEADSEEEACNKLSAHLRSLGLDPFESSTLPSGLPDAFESEPLPNVEPIR